MKKHLWRLLGTGLVLLTMTFITASNSGNAARTAAQPENFPTTMATDRPITIPQGSIAVSEGCPDASDTTTSSDVYDGFLTRTYTDTQGASMTYYLYVPKNYTPQQSYPLVLLLHGGGERGNVQDSLAQNRALLLSDSYANIWSSSTIQGQWPSFIVIPQVMGSNQWVDIPAAQGSYQLAPQPADSLLLAKDIVDALQCEYRGIDPDRLYITGLSMGGYGTWDAIERWPSYFAAAAPIAGAGDPSDADVLTQLPIWAFHGALDPVVPVSGSRDMIEAIRADGGQPNYTEYSQAGHGIWMQVYSSSAFLSWLFAQHKGPA